MNFENSFHEITAILLLAAFIGTVGVRLRQPLIVSFIAVGILVGPSGLHLVSSHDQIELLAEIGIALLLFIVGLKLDLHLIRTVGPVALATGLGQVAFTSFFGFLIALGLGMSTVESVYTAVALTFSSTIIIVKLLSDKKEIDSLHGRIAVGFLIVQDIMVVLAMIGLSTVGSSGEQEWALAKEILKASAKAVLFLGGLLLLMRTVIPWFLEKIARSQELLVLFSIAWAVFLGALGDSLGFSKEVGAFSAGVSLASTQYREAIGSRLVSLRDFLLLFFFIDLGCRLDLSMLGAELNRAGIFSLFVLVGNPIIVMVIMGAMGYRKRTGFLAGLTVAQISEFSLILGALGLSLGHIDKSTMGLITIVGIITIGLSTYMILYSGYLYERLSPWLSVFERRNPHRETNDAIGTGSDVDVLLFGLGRYGSNICSRLLERGKTVVAVDFDPELVASWSKRDLRVLYGDATDPELLEHLPIQHADWLVSAIPELDTNITLLKNLAHTGISGKIVATAATNEDADLLKKAGAHFVLKLFEEAAEHAVDSLTAARHTLPEYVLEGSALKEVRLAPGSALSGKTIADVAVRQEMGVSIVAVSRAGKSYFDPSPDFQLFPGDRLVLFGPREKVESAADRLERGHHTKGEFETDSFSLASLEITSDIPWVNRTIESLNFRRSCGVTILAIKRGKLSLASPAPNELILPGDRLILAGSHSAMKRLEEQWTVRVEHLEF